MTSVGRCADCGERTALTIRALLDDDELCLDCLRTRRQEHDADDTITESLYDFDDPEAVAL